MSKDLRRHQPVPLEAAFVKPIKGKLASSTATIQHVRHEAAGEKPKTLTISDESPSAGAGPGQDYAGIALVAVG